MIKNKIHFNLHIIDVYNIILKEIDFRYTPQKEKKKSYAGMFYKMTVAWIERFFEIRNITNDSNGDKFSKNLRSEILKLKTIS